MEKYITAKDIMKSTGLNKNLVYAMMRFPGFPSTRVGGRILVSEKAFHEWMARGGTEQKVG